MECDISNLAVPTLLLGLLLQREGRHDEARATFEGFARVLDEAVPRDSAGCSCSARVLQAHALFEMKRGDSVRSIELMFRAVRMDRNLRTVLRWKQFRDAMVEHRAYRKRVKQQAR